MNIDYITNLAKLIRLYSDLINNYILNPQWAAVFVENPSSFFVKYLTPAEVVSAGYTINYYNNSNVQLLIKK